MAEPITVDATLAGLRKDVHQLKKAADIEQETKLLTDVYCSFTSICEAMYGLSSEVEHGLVTRSPSKDASFVQPQVPELTEGDKDGLNQLVLYIFDRRFGWSEFGLQSTEVELGSSGNWSEVFERELKRAELESASGDAVQETESRRENKHKLNDTLDRFLRFWLSIPLNREFVEAILHCARHTASKPVVRRQCYDHYFDWMRAQGPSIQPLIGACFPAILELLLSGLKDIWSPIRKHCANKVTVLAEHLHSDDYESLFCSLVDLCLDDQETWQATEGAILGITTLIKRFRWEVQQRSAMEAGANFKPAGSIPRNSPEGPPPFPAAHVLTTGRIITPRLPEFITNEIRNVLFRLLSNPQISIRENATKAFAAFLSRSLFEETLTSFTEVVDKLTPVDLRSEDENPAHGNHTATNAFFHLVSPVDFPSSSTHPQGTGMEHEDQDNLAHSSRAASKDPMRRIRQLTKSSSSPGVLSLTKQCDSKKLLDPFEAEGLLSVCGMLVRQIPASFLYPKWPEFFPTLDRYLAHPASTVRQSTSTIFKYLVMKDGGTSQLTHLVLQSLSSSWRIHLDDLKGIPSGVGADGMGTRGGGGSLPGNLGQDGSHEHHRRSTSALPGDGTQATAPANKGVPTSSPNVKHDTLRRKSDSRNAGSQLKSWQWREGRLLAYELMLKYFLVNQTNSVLTSASRRNALSFVSRIPVISNTVAIAGPSGPDQSPATPAHYQFSPNPNTIQSLGSSPSRVVGDHLGVIDFLRDIDQHSDLLRTSGMGGSTTRHSPQVVHSPNSPTRSGPSFSRLGGGSLDVMITPAHSPTSSARSATAPVSSQRQASVHPAPHVPHHHPELGPHHDHTKSSPESSHGSDHSTPRLHRRQSTSAVSSVPLWTLRFVPVPVREILRQMLFQTMQCYGDSRWEVRRMSEQALKPLTEAIFWFDVGILREVWNEFLNADQDAGTSTMTYVARLSFKYTIKRAASMQLAVQSEGAIYTSPEHSHTGHTNSSPQVAHPAHSIPGTPDSPGARARLYHLIDAVKKAASDFMPILRESAKNCTNERNSLLSLELVMLCHIHFGHVLSADEQSTDASIVVSRLVHFAKLARPSEESGDGPSLNQRRAQAIEKLVVTAINSLIPEFVLVCDFDAHLCLLPLLISYVQSFDEQEVQMSCLEAASRLLSLPLMWLGLPAHTRMYSSPDGRQRRYQNGVATSPIHMHGLHSHSIGGSPVAPSPASSFSTAPISIEVPPVVVPSVSVVESKKTDPTSSRGSLDETSLGRETSTASTGHPSAPSVSPRGHVRRSLSGFKSHSSSSSRSCGLFGFRFCQPPQSRTAGDDGRDNACSTQIQPGRLSCIIEDCVIILADVIENKVLEASLLRRVLDVVMQMFTLIGDLRYAKPIVNAIVQKVQNSVSVTQAGSSAVVLPLLSNDITETSPVDDDDGSGGSDNEKNTMHASGNESDGEDWDDDWDDWDEEDDEGGNLETVDFGNFLVRLELEFSQGDNSGKRDRPSSPTTPERPSTPVRQRVEPDSFQSPLALLSRDTLGITSVATRDGSNGNQIRSFQDILRCVTTESRQCLQSIMEPCRLSEIEVEARGLV